MRTDDPTRPGAALVDETLPDRSSTTAGVVARDLRSGETLVAHRPTVPLLPASNAKLVTTACAFAELGPSYRFETTVHAVGELQDGTLLGDLVVVGRGAPDLSQGDLMSLAADVREAGIETVAGEVVIDASAFGRQTLGPGWTWDDGQYAYGAKSTPLAIERNTVDITVSHRNGSVLADASPASQNVRLDVDVETDTEGSLEVYKKRASEIIRVEGTVGDGETTTASSPVDDPLMHAGNVFRDALAVKGVEVDGWMRISHDPVPVDGVRSFTVDSAPLSTVVRDVLVTSDNFAAEQIARTIALEETGTGTWDAWQEVAAAFLDDRGAGAARLRDGSGVSRYNLLSASTVASVLEWSLTRPWGDQYRTSLPVCGAEGTVTNRCTDVPATVRAKTGTLTGARALSGYVEDDAGDPALVFACLLSNLSDDHEAVATERMDAFVAGLVGATDGL